MSEAVSLMYFDVHHAIEVHDWIINESGGRHGVYDVGRLESILHNIENDDYYPEIWDKITHLVHSVNKFHMFVDGNKRASIALGAYFLQINGFYYCIKRFTSEMENIAVWVAENKIQKDLLGEIVYSLLSEDDYAEELKVKIFVAVDSDESTQL